MLYNASPTRALRAAACLVLASIALAGTARAHQHPDTVRVKVGGTTTFEIRDAGDCAADIWIEDIRDPALVNISPAQGFGIAVDFPVQAGPTPGVTTILVHWVGKDVGREGGHCKEDTRLSGGVEIVLRVTPEFVNSTADADDLDPGDGHCDTGKNVGRGSREEPQCTLRAAISEANAVGGAAITFDIPESGPYIIQPGSPLPSIEAPTSIIGPGSAGKMTAGPAPELTIDGSAAGTSASGLTIASGGIGSTIENLIIHSFGSHGVAVQTADVVVSRSIIGTDLNGAAGIGNGGSGILIEGPPSNTVGGESESRRNVIVGNGRYGVEILSGSLNRILGNWIGLSPDSSKVLSNEFGGVYVNGANNAVGGRTDHPGMAPGNVISGNGSEGGVIVKGGENFVRGNVIGAADVEDSSFGNEGPGIAVEGSGIIIGGDAGEYNVIAGNDSTGILVSGQNSSATIRRNLIYGNEGLGIDLLPPGPTKNDVNDADSGPNSLQNFPKLDSVRVPDPFEQGSTVTVFGKLESAPGQNYQIDLFLSDVCDESGYGQGQRFVEATQVTTNASGLATFSISFISQDDLTYSPKKPLTMTATDALGNTSEFSRCQKPALRIVDYHDNIIPGRAFAFARVADDHPRLTETDLDSLTTDEDGLVYLEDLDVHHDQQLRVHRVLEVVPSAKRPYLPRNAYSVTLDNGNFSDAAELEYDRIDTTQLIQEIKLKHTTFAYNLVVSVEWDARQEYLDNLQESLRLTTNYFYDVSDGQIRFDTIAVFNNGVRWNSADVRIHASNITWPTGTIHGLEKNLVTAKLNMPRRWFGGKDQGRNQSVTENPLNLTASNHYRTLGHEFGHYGLGLWDEYQYLAPDSSSFVADATLHCASVGVIGFMQSQYEASGSAANEMSWARQYTDAACQNTKQYVEYGQSSWDYVESKLEKERDGIFAPIIQPGERALPGGADYFSGPNRAGGPLTYDVGALVTFIADAGSADRNPRLVLGQSRGGTPIPALSIYQKTENGRLIYQGESSDDARMFVLGAAPSDTLLAESGHFQVVGKNQAAEASWSSGMLTGDGTEIVLRSTAGLNRALVSGLPGPDGFTFRLATSQPFSATPGLTSYSDAGTQAHTFAAVAGGYEAAVSVAAPAEGNLITTALDDSSETFFFTSNFKLVDVATIPVEVFGPGGESSVTIDSTSAEIDRILLVSSSYPPIRTGVSDDAYQAGQTHAIALAPDAGAAARISIGIRYADSDVPVPDAEATLRLHRWDENAGWVLIGGAVDTSHNVVTGPAAGTGIYAAFTTAVETSTDQSSDVLPGVFNLHAGYPNPFNPTSTIRFDVAREVHVRLSVYDVLGRRVAVLVDETRQPGSYDAVFNASRLPSGLYVYRIEMGNFTDAKTLLLVK